MNAEGYDLVPPLKLGFVDKVEIKTIVLRVLILRGFQECNQPTERSKQIKKTVNKKYY